MGDGGAEAAPPSSAGGWIFREIWQRAGDGCNELMSRGFRWFAARRCQISSTHAKTLDFDLFIALPPPPTSPLLPPISHNPLHDSHFDYFK